jgi:hypothetical protein
MLGHVVDPIDYDVMRDFEFLPSGLAAGWSYLITQH